MLLPRGAFHYSCYVSWTQNRNRYITEFFERGARRLFNKSMDTGQYLMYLLEHDPEHELVADIPRFNSVEYPLTTLLNGEIPVETHPDSINNDSDWSIYEYKTALWKGKPQWTTSKVYGWVQLPFYAMIVREMNGWYNAYDNFIVEIPTERIGTHNHHGVEWKLSQKNPRQLEVSRALGEDGKYMPPIMHRRIITQGEIDVLRNKAIGVAKEIATEYQNFLKTVEL